METLRPFVASTFQASQSATASHLALSAKLKQAHQHSLESGDGSAFFDEFVRCLDRLLPAPRKDQCAARVIDFVAEYVRQICPEDVENVDESYIQFVEDVVERYARGFVAKQSLVRFRSVLIVLTLVPLAPLRESLLDEIESLSLTRMRDSDARVRHKAAALVSSFEMKPEVAYVLSHAMQTDSSSEVRLTATYNLAHERPYTDLSVQRVRDESPSIRRTMYAKVLRSIHPEVMKVDSLWRIVRAGLTDRDPSVRKACENLVAHRWVAVFDGNILDLLGQLAVVDDPQPAELVMAAFYDVRPDVLEEMDFGSEFFDYGPEGCVLLRTFQNYCRKHNLVDLLEERMPDLALVSSHIGQFWAEFTNPETYSHLETDDAYDLKNELTFKIEQLLQIATLYDYGDEVGRQRLVSAVAKIAMDEHAPSDETITHIIAIQRRLNSSDTALMSWAFETIDAIPGPSTQVIEADDTGETNESLLDTLLRSLSLFRAVLRCVSPSPDISPWLDSVFSQYVSPALHSPMSEVQCRGREVLALACLVDERFASEHYATFLALLDKGLNAGIADSEAQGIALSIRALSDIALSYGGAAGSINDAATLFIRAIDVDYTNIRQAAALSLAQVLLSRLFDDDLTALKTLVGAYFITDDDYQSSDDLTLMQQQLSLFLRSYSLYDEGRNALGAVFVSVVGDFMNRASSLNGSVTLADVVNQLVYLTADDPTRDGNSFAHALIARGVLTLLDIASDAQSRRSLVSVLSKLELTPLMPPETFAPILEALHGVELAALTALMKKTLEAFGARVTEVLAEAETRVRASKSADEHDNIDSAGSAIEGIAAEPITLEPAIVNAAAIDVDMTGTVGDADEVPSDNRVLEHAVRESLGSAENSSWTEVSIPEDVAATAQPSPGANTG